MIWTTTKEKIKRLSQKIVEVQKPIRILDAIKWSPSIEKELRKSHFKAMPKVGPEYYEKINIGFDPKKKKEELAELSQEIKLVLGETDALGLLFQEIVREYRDVVEMLLARGTKKFWEMSRSLYGSPKDHFFDDKNTIFELGQLLYSILSGINHQILGSEYAEDCDAAHTVEVLKKRLSAYFHRISLDVKISDGILADASAGGDTVKIKEGSMFSLKDIDILEVHEGWVHVGTTQNGMQQHIAKWLSKGPPRCSATQEGLAVIMEIFTFRSYPRRLRQINDRILGIAKAEEGANLIELIEFFRTEGYSEEDALASVIRIFRGGVVEGGAPFTKDISYCRGFVENYNFMRTAVRAGKPELLPFLFVGKIRVDDVPLLYQKYLEGIVDFPMFLPKQFKDLNGILVWMSFSSFFNMVDLKKVQEHYNKLFEMYL